jgi:hypothetical protein
MHTRIRELLEYLDAQRVMLRDAFDAVPASRRDAAPAPGCWSTAGIVEHLAIVEGRLAGFLKARIEKARADGLAAETSTDPILPTIDVSRVLNRSTRVNAPEAVVPAGMPADAAWAALERSGVSLRDVFRSGDGLALGSITFPHPLFGPLTVYEWIAVAAAHEARHAAQIREMAASAAEQTSQVES